MGLNLLSIVWDVNPVIVQIGGWGIRWYGLLWAIGIMACYWVQIKLYNNEKCPQDWQDKIFIWMVLGVIIGARLGHCFFYEWHLTNRPIQIFGWLIRYRNPYIEHPFNLLRIWEGGLSSHGGAIGLIISAYFLNKLHFSKNQKIKTNTIWIFDRLVIGICLTATCIRLGNLMNSEIYGLPTNLPWGFIFVRDGQTQPCHPTQIYEMIYCIVAFIITWTMYWKYEQYRYRGRILGVFLLIVFVTRFFIEFIKNDQELFEQNMPLNLGQWLSLPFVIWGIYLIFCSIRQEKTAKMFVK